MGANQALVDTLLATFSSLPIEERIVLELVSVHYDPLTSSKALSIVNLASKRNVSVKPLGLPTWKRLSKKLRTAGLLQGRAGTIQCNSKIVDAITRNALGEGRLNTHLQVLYGYRPDMDPENSLYGVNYTYDGILAKLRLAVHTNDVEGFVFLREDWYGRGWYLGVAPFAWEQGLFGHPLDVGWLQTGGIPRNSGRADGKPARSLGIQSVRQPLGNCPEGTGSTRNRPPHWTAAPRPRSASKRSMPSRQARAACSSLACGRVGSA